MTSTTTTTTNNPETKRSNIFDEPITLQNWYKHIDWISTPILTLTPLIGLYGLMTVPIQYQTAVWTIIYYFFTGMGITAGYHRLWSHRSYRASGPYEAILLLAASGAMEGSARWWCRHHRAHHRFTDTEKDPYNAQKGLFYSHIGWMLIKHNPQKLGKVDISDLNANPMIRVQHRYYLPIALIMGFILPMLVAGLGWGDWRGGFFFAGVVRMVLVHHATFCVNSLAHYLGETTFDDRHSPRDHFFTAIMTMGEGYHNFHHEFPMDYRNAIRFYQYDPTKWLIRICSWFGITYNLKKFPENEIKKGNLLMKEKKLNSEKRRLFWGKPIDKLPVFTFEEFKEYSKTNKWILIEGIIYDVTDFIDEHPGGRSFIITSIGKDMTTSFNGGVYDHSNAARNLMANYRIGVISGGGEVEHQKEQ